MADERRPVALVVALVEEAAVLIRRLERSTRTSPGLAIWEGSVEGTPVVLVIAGVGKVSAALATQFLVDTCGPRCCVAFGIAGATAGGQPGEMIVASGALQHDMDARPLTDEKGVVPGLEAAVLAADPRLTERLRLAVEATVGDSERIRSGVVLTGDQIITSRATRDQLLRQFPGGVCFDMETAAVAQVARQNGIPWAALRITSDSADEDFDLDEVIGFGVDTAALHFDTIVRAFLKYM